METVIRVKKDIDLKNSKHRKKSKLIENVSGKIKKAEELIKSETKKKLGNLNAQVSTSSITSINRNSENNTFSILSKPLVKLSPKPKSKKSKKSKLSNSTLKGSISNLCSKTNFANSHITKTNDKNPTSHNYPQKPALLKGKINLNQNKPKKPNTGNKLSASSKKSIGKVTINTAKQSNTENDNKEKIIGKVKVKAQKTTKEEPQAPILQAITTTLNSFKTNNSKPPINAGIKDSKYSVSNVSQFNEYSSCGKLNSTSKNLNSTENGDQSASISEKLPESKETYNNSYKLKIQIDLVKKESNCEKSQNESKRLNKIHSTAIDKHLRDHKISQSASIPILAGSVAQKKSAKLLLRDKAEKRVRKSENLELGQPTNHKDEDSTLRKLFNPKKDKATPSNKPQNQILRQKVKYQDSLIVEIQRLASLIDLGNSLIDADMSEWKRLVLNHNQLISLYKTVILNHYETFNKMKTSWLRQSWEIGTSKLLNQLDRIDIAKNKFKYALIRAVISHTEQIYNDICVTTNEFSEFEGLRQLLLGGLGVNRIKNSLLDIKIEQNENAKQILIHSTRKHLFRAISLNPNLGSAYHQLALLNIMLDSKDMLPCMLLYSIGSVSDCFESSSKKVLDELYQQCNWDSSPLHGLLRMFCKLATEKSEELLGDQISKWIKAHKYIDWSCIDLFNITVIGLISYTGFRRSFEELKYVNDTQIPLIQLILVLFDTNIANLGKNQTEADHTILIHSLLNLYLWIDCNKIYPCQFDYSNPNPISLSEGWSTIVNGLNLFYFNFSNWDYTNATNNYSSNSTPMSWIDIFKSKIAYILGQQNSQTHELDSSSDLNQTPSDCVKAVLNLGLSWTKLPKSIIKFSSKNGFSIHMNNRVYSTKRGISNDADTSSISSIDSSILYSETYLNSGTASPIYSSEKIIRLRNQIKTLTRYIDGNTITEKDFSKVNQEDIYLVLDTNFFINHFKFVKFLINLQSFRIIIPALAISELKGLCRDISISLKCNLTINLLCSLFTPPGPPEHVKILTTLGESVSHPHFVYEKLPKSQHYNSKDVAILELCILLSSEHTDKHIALITEDKNMRIRARSCGIEIFSKNRVEKLMKNGSH